MFLDDPKDAPDAPDEDVDPDDPEDDEPSDDDEPEPKEGDDPEGDGGEDEDQDEPEGEDDLPDDPKVLKALLRRTAAERQSLLERVGRGGPATDADPEDPIEAPLKEFLQEEGVSKATKRVVLGLMNRLAAAETSAAQSAHDARARQAIPPEHLAAAEAIAAKHNVPLIVAARLHKADLYDKAMARRKAKKAEDEEPEQPRGSAKSTSLRPVRPGGGSGKSGGSSLTVKTAGGALTVKTHYKSPSEYATFMDSLPPAKRRVVLALRTEGRVKVG